MSFFKFKVNGYYAFCNFTRDRGEGQFLIFVSLDDEEDAGRDLLLKESICSSRSKCLSERIDFKCKKKKMKMVELLPRKEYYSPLILTRLLG